MSVLLIRETSAAPRASDRLAFASASAATLLGALGLLGWMTPARWLASLSATSIPMAPSTALAFLLLGGAMALEARQRHPHLTTAVSFLVLAFSCVELTQFLAHLSPWVDALLVPAPDASFGVPTGRMSPLTAVGLLLASLGLVFLGPARAHRVAGTAGAGLAALVCLLAAVVTLGYLFGARAPLRGASHSHGSSHGTGDRVSWPGTRGTHPEKQRSPAAVRRGLGEGEDAPRVCSPLRPQSSPESSSSTRSQGYRPGLHVALSVLLSTFLLAAAAAFLARGIFNDLSRAQAERERSRGDADRLAAIVESSSDAHLREEPRWNDHRVEPRRGTHVRLHGGRSARRDGAPFSSRRRE